MATSKKTGLRHAELPAVDAVRFPDNPAATRAWEQMRQVLGIRHGRSGQQTDRAVTFGDLVEMGVVSMRGADGRMIQVTDPSGPFLPPATKPEPDGIPPAPTGVTVTPALSTIIIEWDKPSFAYFGYAEVYRSTTNNLAQAQYVGQTTGWILADTVPGSATYYYWVRFVSAGGKPGPFNDVGGIAAAASLDPTYLIDVLSSNSPKALLYEIEEPTIIGGVPVPAGIYIRDLYVANGSIGNLKLANLAVDDAKVANLSAAKIVFGEMSGDRIAANSLNANRIITSTLAARLATITEAYVGTANILDAAITSAKIGNASITAAKIIDGQITAAKIAAANVLTAHIGDAQITAAKIAAANILAAHIGDAQITTAKIGFAQVDRLRIAGNSVTLAAAFIYPPETIYLQGEFPNTYKSFSFYIPEPGNVVLYGLFKNHTVANFTPSVWVYLDGEYLGRIDSYENQKALLISFRYLAAGTHYVSTQVYRGTGLEGPLTLESYFSTFAAFR